MVHIKPNEGHKGNHVFASNGEWACDRNGWTRESELLYAVEQGFSSKYPDVAIPAFESILADETKGQKITDIKRKVENPNCKMKLASSGKKFSH